MDTPKLSERIGRERLDKLVDAYAAKGGADLDAEVTGILAAHLADLRDRGVIVPHTSLPNRRINLIHSWNVMCGIAEHRYSTQDGETMQVARRMQHALISMPLRMLAFDVERGTVDAESRDAKMHGIMSEMDTGDLPWWKLGAHETDFVTGEELDFEMKAWALVFGRREGRGDALVPAEDVPPVRMHAVEMDLPTGEILIADWFRAEGFTDLVDEGDPWRGGSQDENERDAERYAREHGFISVCSVRRSLSVLRKGDRITVGHHDEDGDHPAPAGYRLLKDLLIDLRKVSVVDKASLVETLGRVHARERAAEMVEAIAADHGTVQLRVPPGRYRFLSSGRGWIEDLLPGDDPLRTEGYEPVLVIERV